MLRRLALVSALPLAFGIVTSCVHDPNSESSDGATTDGGNTTGSGGQRAGTGGATGSGGRGSGGAVGTGGGTGTGGGAPGGGTGTGGSASGGSGGGTGTGGRGGSGVGGTVAATGGRGGSGVGGTVGATGGRPGTGGAASGGAPGSGGNRGSGGAAGSGGSGTGGSGAATACSLTNHSGMGQFTHYYFGMGTGQDSSGTGYRTACGYYGTEGGSSASGPNDTVQNIASAAPASSMYFAAIPGTSGFDSKTNCGACIQITGANGKMVTATIIDECPYGSDGGNTVCQMNPTGELDLSTALFDQLGYATGNPTGTTWKFVPCPVTGNVILQIKAGNQNEIFIQNTVLALTSVARGSEIATRQSYGAWHFGSNLNVGDTLTLVDAANRSLSVQVSSTAMRTNQDTGKQFPACQ
jgi:expansin (peptidoglycan-binding protein)